MDSTQRARLRALKDCGYLDQLAAWAKGCCAPVFYRDAAGVRHNGTMTFVDTGSAVLGITAAHVADAVLAHCNDGPGQGCQVGAAELTLDRFIARHSDRDLATFRLSTPFLAAAGHYAASVSRWPPTPGVGREMVLYGGYPATYREESEHELDVAFVWFAVWVETSGWNVNAALRIADSLTADTARVPAHVDLGGWSGGPVFRILGDVIERLELTAVIYEYTPVSEIVLAHCLSCIASDGSPTY